MPIRNQGCSEGLRDRKDVDRAPKERLHLLRRGERCLPGDSGAELPPRRAHPQEIRSAGRERAQRQAPPERPRRLPPPLQYSPRKENGGHDSPGHVRVDEQGQQRPENDECRAPGARGPPPDAEDREQTDRRQKRGERVRADLRRHLDQQGIVNDEGRRQGRGHGTAELPGERRRSGHGQQAQGQREDLERNFSGPEDPRVAGQEKVEERRIVVGDAIPLEKPGHARRRGDRHRNRFVPPQTFAHHRPPCGHGENRERRKPDRRCDHRRAPSRRRRRLRPRRVALALAESSEGAVVIARDVSGVASRAPRSTSAGSAASRRTVGTGSRPWCARSRWPAPPRRGRRESAP